MDLSVIIVTWNGLELTRSCLRCLEEELQPQGNSASLLLEVFVVDNGSRDGTAEQIAHEFRWAEVIALPTKVGFARANNVALAKASGRVVLLLNNDARLARSAVDRCMAVLDQSTDVAIVGPQLLHPDGRLQNSVHAFPSLLTELVHIALLEWLFPRRFPSKRHPHSAPVQVEAVLGAALFARREAICQAGPLCEDYFFFLEETDWCWRMREAGWRVLHAPDARMVHLSGASSKSGDRALARIEFHRSLYHFLRVHRGTATFVLSLALRMIRGAISLVLLAPAALVSPRQRRRLGERWRLLRWHLRGCPAGVGLSS
jgi:GT2 family glycosyltransferase